MRFLTETTENCHKFHMDLAVESQKPLSRLFGRMTKGNRQAWTVVKALAETARQIDPDCPYGAHGVLNSIHTYIGSPQDLVRYYDLCGRNPLVMNAVDYAIYQKFISEEQFKQALRKNDFSTLNLPRLVERVRAHHGRFAQYHNRKLRT